MGKGGLNAISAWRGRAGTERASVLQQSRGLPVANGSVPQTQRWEACPDAAVRSEQDGMPWQRRPRGGSHVPSGAKVAGCIRRMSGQLGA
jgi:hypothetical protein